MKLSKITAVLVCFNSNSWVASGALGIRGNLGSHHRLLNEEEFGTFLISDVQFDHAEYSKSKPNGRGKNKPHQSMNIQLDNGLIYSLTNVNPTWSEANGKGKGLKSGQSKIKLGQGATVSGGTIDLHGGAPEVVDDVRGAKKGKVKNKGGRDLEAAQNRHLQSHIGTKTVLAVRVVASDGSYDFTEAHLRDKVFDDSINLATQFRACSYGQLDLVKTPDRAMANNPGDATTNISGGVVTIQVPTSTGQGDGTMVNDITSKISSVFGVSPSEMATHVMYCLPPNTMNGIAYAYINSWLSVYSNDWCNYVSAQMHEVGHNLGWAHSGEGTEEYGDQSGMMGYSYPQDDGPTMCLNAAKSFESQWYLSSTKVITPTASTNFCFDGDLYGIADYDAANNSKTVVVKINDGRNGEEDYYVAFNRRAGINAGTVEGANQVLVTRSGAENGAYATSTLVAKLSAGGSHTISNFAGTNEDVVIVVDSIDTASNPGLAQVRIEYANVRCTPCLGMPVRVNVRTDGYPGETNWSLVNTCTGTLEKSSALDLNTPYTAANTLYSDEYCVADAEYTFTISDSYGDGVCCGYGEGNYSIEWGPNSVIIEGDGQFGTSASKTFGSCGAQPTLNPTPNPTKQPTNNPTPLPTFSPTEAPSPLPTDAPTKTPTNAPTANPTNSPTDQPTTSNPTAQPTANPTNSPPVPCLGMPVSVNVRTDQYPGEVSWQLINTCTNNIEKSSAVDLSTPYTAANTLYSDEYCVADAEYTFTISDSYGDGVCCGYGEGNYSIEWGPDSVIIEGDGQFGSSASKTFGSCGAQPTPPPTPNPTPQPTPNPTPPPTMPPINSFDCSAYSRKRDCRIYSQCRWKRSVMQCINV